MVSSLRRLVASLAVATVLVTIASAAQNQTPAPAPAPEYVESSGFKSRIYEVKHRDPASLVAVLRPLSSGYKGATISASAEYRTLSVRDVPENLAVIEEAIKRLDVPQPARADVELHLHVLVAEPTGSTSELPAEIRGAVEQLRATLNFKGFTLLTPIIQRTREGDWNTEGNGVGGGNDPSGFRYTYRMRSVSRSNDVGGGSRVQLNGFEFEFNGGASGPARVQCNLSLKDGEQVVVGTASLTGGRALVLILSARVVS